MAQPRLAAVTRLCCSGLTLCCTVTALALALGRQWLHRLHACRCGVSLQLRWLCTVLTLRRGGGRGVRSGYGVTV
jgi:hypothetical protein